jgi:hypothetical protein
VGGAGGFVVGHEPLQVLEVFTAAFAGWCDDLAVGLCCQALVAGVGEDLQVDGVGEEVDQAGIPGLGDVGNRSRSYSAPSPAPTTPPSTPPSS